MKRTLWCFLFCLIACDDKKNPIVVAQGFLHPESAVVSENFIYVTNQGKRDWSAKDGDGTVTKLDKKGKVINKKFATGLNDPRGVDIYQDTLVMTDNTEVALIDIADGQIVRRIKTPAVFLNDLHVGKNHMAYVSDTLGKAIYRINLQNGDAEKIISDMEEAPNGLYTKGDWLYVATWATGLQKDWSFDEKGSLIKMDLKSGEIKDLSEKNFGHLDAIIPYGDDQWLVSDKKANKILIFNEKDKSFEELDHEFLDVADISYDEKGKFLVAPLTTSSQVKIYYMD